MEDEVALPPGFSRIPNQTSFKFESKLMGASPDEDHHTKEKERNINQHSERNTTHFPKLEEGIDLLGDNQMESRSPEPLDWVSECVEEEEQSTSRGGEGMNQQIGW